MNDWRKAWAALLCIALLFSGAGPSIASPEKNSGTSLASVDLANSSVQTTQSRGETVFQLTPKDLSMAQFQPRADGMEQLVLGDWTAGGEAGAPQMPFKLFRLLVPPDAEMGTAQATLVGGQWQALPGAHHLAPNPPVMTSEVAVATPAASSDRSIYGRDSFFPPQPIEIVSVGCFRQWKLVEVRFWPVRYNPAQGRVEQLTQPSIRLSLSQQADFQPLPEDVNAGLFLEQLQQMV